MRKTFILAAIAAAACLWSCAKAEEKLLPDATEEEQTAVPEGFKVITIEATRSASQQPATAPSKTSYANEVTFSWTAGDQISVLCNDGNENFWQTFTAASTAAVSRFTATVANNVEMGPLDGSKKVALFPASASHVYTSESSISFHIPAEKDFRSASGGHTSADVPMFAWGDSDDNYAFANIAGAVKFSFSGVPTSTAKLVFHNTCHLKLNGTYALSLNADANNVSWSAANTETASEETVTMYGDVSAGNVSFYVPYATSSLWAYNTLTLSDPASGTVFYNNNTVGQIDVTKNSIAVTPTLPAVVPSFASAYGIDWSGIAAAENTNDTYPAITKMKATGDANYLYLYMEVDASAVVKDHVHDHYFNIYLSDPSGSTRYWGAATCSVMDDAAWAVSSGNQSFENWNDTDFSRNLADIFGTWYYEIRINRSFNPILAAGGEVGVAVALDDVYYDGTNYLNLNSYTPYGIIPTRGTDMYTVNFPSSLSLSFTESTEEIINPERGFYKHLEYKFNGSLPSASSISYSSGSLVLALFYLTDFISSEHLSSEAVTRIGEILAKVREAGKKAVVRFAYTWDEGETPHEPAATYLLNHISDVAGKLSDYEDVIYTVQAGFLGTWGEWYYVGDDFAFSTSDGNFDRYANRTAVVNALLAAVPESRQVELRTPHYKSFYINQAYTYGWTPISAWDGTDANSRLGFHNDGFRGSESDIGTFKNSDDRAMCYSQSAWTVSGGELAYPSQKDFDEMVAADSPLVDIDATITEIGNQHFSYLHDSSSNKYITLWSGTPGNIDKLKKALGYRLVLNTVNLGYTALTSGSTVTYSIAMSNTGSAPVINKRPFKLVLLHEGTPTVLVANLGEIRSVAAGGSETFSGSFSLPQNVVSGDKLAIWLPDNAAGLQSNASYSIRLANSDVTWSSGYNIIHTF